MADAAMDGAFDGAAHRRSLYVAYFKFAATKLWRSGRNDHWHTSYWHQPNRSRYCRFRFHYGGHWKRDSGTAYRKQSACCSGFGSDYGGNGIWSVDRSTWEYSEHDRLES
jgi:hypothetical protein